MADFIPSRQSVFVSWTTNFAARISATPTAFGLTAGQATAYQTLNDAFLAAYALTSSDATRTPSAIIAKDEAMATLKTSARALAGIIQECPIVTNPQRSDLGLTVRDIVPSPVTIPAFAPDVDVVSATGRVVRIRIHDSQSERRGKPDGVAGAVVYSFVGATPPDAITEWTFEGTTTRTSINIVFPDSVAAGAMVWFTACWFNPRQQNGPSANTVSANLPGGLSMAA